MLDACDGFLLLLHNLGFGAVSELNDFLLFSQSDSQHRVLNVQTRCVSIHLIFRKVSFDGRRLLNFAPLRHLGTHYLNLAAWFEM